MKLILTALVTAILTITTGTVVQAEEVVPPEKIWTIAFNTPMDFSGVEDHVFLTDEEGRRHKIGYKAGEKGKKLFVGPEEEYIIGKTYSLSVKEGLLSEAGEPLKEEVDQTFTVKDPLSSYEMVQEEMVTGVYGKEYTARLYRRSLKDTAGLLEDDHSVYRLVSYDGAYVIADEILENRSKNKSWHLSTVSLKDKHQTELLQVIKESSSSGSMTFRYFENGNLSTPSFDNIGRSIIFEENVPDISLNENNVFRARLHPYYPDKWGTVTYSWKLNLDGGVFLEQNSGLTKGQMAAYVDDSDYVGDHKWELVTEVIEDHPDEVKVETVQTNQDGNQGGYYLYTLKRMSTTWKVTDVEYQPFTKEHHLNLVVPEAVDFLKSENVASYQSVELSDMERKMVEGGTFETMVYTFNFNHEAVLTKVEFETGTGTFRIIGRY
ncbi:Ig-like domain-containing protein [Salimicrobium halophilum]|uniref:Ig-like domain-containing protein n=1 Tax=Salimicrobium halophilum TaxID=86666 RepID=UPI00115FAF60|nr:hypothetical protein [Salimicrobium halophilum]